MGGKQILHFFGGPKDGQSMEWHGNYNRPDPIVFQGYFGGDMTQWRVIEYRRMNATNNYTYSKG